MNPADLEWERVPLADAQMFKCNYCGHVGMTNNWWLTRVRFMKEAEFKIVVCSDACKISFQYDDKTPKFLESCVQDMSQLHKLKIKNKLIDPTIDHGSN